MEKKTKSDLRIKLEQAAHLDSSLALYFVISAIAVSYVFSTSFADSSGSFVVILAAALLVYFMLDFIKQLYDPVQSVFLYAVVFVGMPLLGVIMAGGGWWFAGLVAFGAAYILSLVAEIIYNLIAKPLLPKALTSRLASWDRLLDNRLLFLQDKQLSLYEWRGLIFGLLLVFLYIGLTITLFYL